MVTCEPHVGIRVEDRGRRQPAAAEFRELVPGQSATALAAATQRTEPHVYERIPELLQAFIIAGDSIILTPAPKHGSSDDLGG